MLKRKLGVVVVGMLLGAQVGLASAAESAIPLGEGAIMAKTAPPWQATFQSQHADSATALRGDAVPADVETIIYKSEPPVQTTFKQQHRDSVTAPSGNAVPADAEAIINQGEPGR